jgi:hypothetical protein
MSRISQDLQELERMIDDGETDKIKSQLRFIAEQVSTLEAQYASLEQENADFQAAHAEPTMQHRRGLYYASGDPIPFCPRCYEAQTPAGVHLFGPVPRWANTTGERWECHTCNTAYVAPTPNENFLPNRPNVKRLRQ